MVDAEAAGLLGRAASASDVVGPDGCGAVGGAEEVDLVLEKGDDWGGFEEPFDVCFGARDVAGFVAEVAFGEVGGADFGRGGVGEDGEEVGPCEIGLFVFGGGGWGGGGGGDGVGGHCC